MSSIELNSSVLNKLPWRLTTDFEFLTMLQRLDEVSVPITKHAEIFNGIQTSAERPTPIYWFSSDEIVAEYADTVEISRDGNNYTIEKALLRPYFKPTKKAEKGLNSYSILATDKQIIFPYDNNGHLICIDEMQSSYPGTYAYLLAHYDRLVPKCVSRDGTRDVPNATADTWYQYGRTQALTAFINTPKLIVGVLSKEPMYAMDTNDILIASGGTAGYCAVSKKDGSPYTLEYIQAWLSNPITERILEIVGSDFEGGFTARGTFVLSTLPFVELDFAVEEQKGEEEKGIRIIEMNNLRGFAQLDLSQNGFQKLQHVKEKWTKYFVNAEEMSLIQELRADKRFAQFSEYGIINVGITTGNNGYFSITEETSEQYQLSEVTLPLIGRSSHAHGIYFTAQDWEKNKTAGKRARLINFPEIPYDEYPAKHKEYISLGEANGEHEGYKCSIRERWYIVPSVWVPDAFFLRRNNLYPKFVLNECNAVSTDTMHRIKFNDGVDPENVLLAYYNSISFAFTEICGRSYGGGVLEILPGEMGNILLPKVERIDPALRDKLLAHIDTIVRNDEDIELALDVVDKELLVDTLGIDPEICRKCRAIWKKMQTRRLGRG